jgi:hypothetical protein
MGTGAVFATTKPRAGIYESFYLRAFAPERPLGVWIRYTVHKRRGAEPRGSLWFTALDGNRPRPFQHKLTGERLCVPEGGWIEVEGARFGPLGAEGSCGGASWSLRFEPQAPELRHLQPDALYRAPLPRTKLTSPAPLALFSGHVQLPGEEAIAVDAWPGMVGHNWGAEHAERWIWLHGGGFAEDPSAWLDVGIGRVLVAGRLTPWVANGAIAAGGVTRRLGGLRARGLSVLESATGCELQIPAAGGAVLRARVIAPPQLTAGWRYADPDGGEHDVVNCSLASLAVSLEQGHAAATALSSEHGGAYELGMRERDHGVPIAPFRDG